MANTEGTGLIFPKQRLSYTEKTKNDYAWAKKMVDLLILNYATDQSYVSTNDSDYQRMVSNYQLYNNFLNQADFERECNPLGLEVGQYKDEIKAYNKAPNKINVLLGEAAKRPFNFKTVLTNSEGIKSRQEAKTQLLQRFVESYVMDIVSKYNPKVQVNPETQQQELVKPEHLEEYMAYSYLDAREKLANKLLQYLIRKENIFDKMLDGLKHGLLSGYEYVWVGIENGEPVVQVLNSLGHFHHKSPEVKFVEDGLYAGYRTRMTTGDIIDKLGNFLKESDIEKLEGNGQSITGMDSSLGNKKMQYYTDDVTDMYLRNGILQNTSEEGSYSKPKAEDWVVTHVEWVSQKKVGFIKRVNEYGEEETVMVNEDFKVPSYATSETVKEGNKRKTYYYFDDMELTWGWIPEVWEGIRIGSDIYCCLGPKAYQFRSADNPQKVKLGYHGICYSAMNADPVSLMDRMKPFQYLYFFIAHKLKKLIARDRGQVFHFDMSMIPEQIGLEKTIYYLEEMDIDFFDPLKNAEAPGAFQRGKIAGATSRSNMQHILNYVQLLAAIDEQISDVAGITRQREGQTTPNQAVTNAQQDLIQSATITETIYFRPHEKVWENVLNSLLQCAQVAWQNKSVIRQYVLDDLSVQTLQLTPGDLLNSDFGVFVSNSTKDVEVFESLKGLAQPLIQNDKAKFSDIIKLLKATSVRELELGIAESEKKIQEEQLQQIQAQQQAQMQAQEIQLQIQERTFEHQKELQAQKDTAALEREMIKAAGFTRDNDVNNNQIPDPLEYEKFREELNLEYTKIKHEASEAEKDRASKEKIAKLSKKQQPISRSKK